VRVYIYIYILLSWHLYKVTPKSHFQTVDLPLIINHAQELPKLTTNNQL